MTLEDLFKENHAGLFRFVARMTNDAEFAKDVVQDTFLHLARQGGSDVPSRAWVYQLARNLARSGLRKRERRLHLLRREGSPATAADPAPSPDTAVQRREAHAVVRAALAELSEKERTILLMREEGFTHREIAEAVGTTVASVGTMYARALRKLEGLLGGKDGASA